MLLINMKYVCIYNIASFGVQTTQKSLKEIATSDDMISSKQGNGNDNDSNQNIPLYAFSTPSPQWQKRLTRDVPIPEPLFGKISSASAERVAYDHEVQFYLGAAGTGAPIHYHGHAINTLAYGEKVKKPHCCISFGCCFTECCVYLEMVALSTK